VAFSPDGQRNVAGSWDKTVRVWSAESGEQLHEMRDCTTSTTSVVFSPSGQRSVSNPQKILALVWSAYTGRQLKTRKRITFTLSFFRRRIHDRSTVTARGYQPILGGMAGAAFDAIPVMLVHHSNRVAGLVDHKLFLVAIGGMCFRVTTAKCRLAAGQE